MKEAAESISIYGAKNTLIRSDKLIDGEWVDVLYDGKEHQLIYSKEEPIIDIRKYRDVYCSALAVFLLERGRSVRYACEQAQKFVNSYKIPV